MRDTPLESGPLRLLASRLLGQVLPSALILLTVCLSGCYSLVEFSGTREIGTESGVERIMVEVWEPVGHLNDPAFKPSYLPGILLLYPIDAVLSLFISLGIATDSEVRIRCGPAGTVAAILSPGVTLMPGLGPTQGASAMIVEPAEFDHLRTALGGRHAREELAARLGVPVRQVSSWEVQPTQRGRPSGARLE